MSRPFLTARWRNLVMLNFEVDPELLIPFLPRGTELDTFGDQHFVSIIAFQFLDTRVLGLSIPCHRDFEEINLRFYVRRYEGYELRRGVVFLYEIVKLRAVAMLARRLYNENYHVYPTNHSVMLPSATQAGRLEYRWGDVRAGAEMIGAPQPLTPGSAEEFITEHYWGYACQRDGATMEYRVDHPPWNVWRAERSWLAGDLAAIYGEKLAEPLRHPPASVFVADGSAISVAKGRRLPD